MLQENSPPRFSLHHIDQVSTRSFHSALPVTVCDGGNIGFRSGDRKVGGSLQLAMALKESGIYIGEPRQK